MTVFQGEVVDAMFGMMNHQENHPCLRLAVANEHSVLGEKVFLAMNQIVQYRESLRGNENKALSIEEMFMGAKITLEIEHGHAKVIMIDDCKMVESNYEASSTCFVKNSAVITSLSYSLCHAEQFHVSAELSINSAPNEIIHAKVAYRLNVQAFTQAVVALGKNKFVVNAQTLPVHCTVSMWQAEGGSRFVNIFMNEDNNHELLLTVPANGFKVID